MRYEFQTLYDMNGASFLDARNLGPRVGVVYDPFNDGRSKISAAYGQFYEAIPLDIAARYFGGENFVQRQEIPLSDLRGPRRRRTRGPATASGAVVQPRPPPDNGGGYNLDEQRRRSPQSHIKGQYQNEVVATLEREVMEDMTVRLDYTHRWLGTIIEDGYGDATLTDVLANPGNVPAEALADAKSRRPTSLDMMAAADPNEPDAAVGRPPTRPSKYNDAPGPRRGAQARAHLRRALADAQQALLEELVRRAASYTYSRLVGNYEGLYQAEQNYVAPNGTNAYDTPDLYVNARGHLPNDHPHQGKLDGYYSHPVGPGKLTLGLSFLGALGHAAQLHVEPHPGRQLPDRLPAAARLGGPHADDHAARRPHRLRAEDRSRTSRSRPSSTSSTSSTSRTTLHDRRQLHLRRGRAHRERHGEGPRSSRRTPSAAPVAKNANFGHAISYQAPFYSRLGLRLMF